MNGADTVWIFTATALVLFMTLPGIALFYGGLVRSRNVLSVLMQCFTLTCLLSLLWFALGYSIAFGTQNPIWGGLGKAFLLGVTPQSLTQTIPEILFFTFQMTFAIITPVLMIGAFVERVHFGFLLVISSLWLLLVYAPVTHWIWGGGMLSGGENALFAEPVLDFAGGIVVHQTAGLSALLIAAMMGGRRNKNVPPHNPVFVMIGASMLWVGWFGFNGGSALAVNEISAMAIAVTHISAASAAVFWAGYEWLKYGKATLIGVVTGAIAGLASITPASGFVTPMEALFIGAVAGIVCQEMCRFIKGILRIDDTLDVFAVHGVGGIWGIIMLAVLGYADWTAQLGGLAVVGGFSLLVTYVLVKVVGLFLPLRVSEEAEALGLDFATHGERAYSAD